MDKKFKIIKIDSDGFLGETYIFAMEASIKELPGLSFLIHPSFADSNMFTVSEKTSGIAVVHGDTIKQARKNAVNKIMEHGGVESFKKRLQYFVLAGEKALKKRESIHPFLKEFDLHPKKF